MTDQASQLIAETNLPAAGRRADVWRAVFRKPVTRVAAALILFYALVAFLGPILLPLDP